MSQESDHASNGADQKQPSRRWLFAKIVGIGLLLVVIALVLIQVALDPPHENELGLRGGLKVEVDPSVEVYIGNKHVGTGLVELTWDDLLGTGEKQSLAMPINADAPSPTTGEMGGVSAETLSGEGSQIVWKRVGMSGSAQNLEPITFTWKQVLLRRPTGELDAVSVLDGEFRVQAGTWRRFLVPIRLRSTSGNTEYFPDTPSGGVSSARGGIVPATKLGSALWLRLQTKHERPPDEFADEIATNGLWRPGQQTKKLKMPTMTSSITTEQARILAPLEEHLWRRRVADVYRIVFVREQVAPDETRKDRTHEVRVVFEADDAEGEEVTKQAAALLEDKFGMRIDK